ncbi:MAG: CAP domain-containing protein [Candidatus Spyradocola sp.]
MIKFAAILTTAAIACSGAAAPAKQEIACRIAALRCNRPAVTCTVQACPTATPAPTETPAETPEATPAPTVTPSPTSAPSEGTDEVPGVSEYAQEVVRLVNVERKKAGLAPLTMDATLSAAAQVRAQEIDVSFSHTRPDGTSCFTVLKEFGISYRACGENIAKGSPSPARVVEGWMNSAGHRANILNENFTAIGVGVHADAAGTLHWAQLFTA